MILPKLSPDVVFGESSSLCPQEFHLLLVAEMDLVSDRDYTLGEVVVVFPHEFYGDHQVVNVRQNQCAAVVVLLLALEEADWVVAPVSTRIEMV